MMKELKRTECIKVFKIESLEMSYETQDEFEKHSNQLYSQGWSRDIYSHVYNFETQMHEYVLYTRETEMI